MFIDMHVHSQASDDAGATVEAYLRWAQVLRRNYQLDGLVFTEHRQYLLEREEEYERLSQRFDIVVLQGAEVETDWGHFLLYGLTEELIKEFDLGRPNLEAVALIEAVNNSGGIAIPAHPGRERVGLFDCVGRYAQQLDKIKVIELLNGANKPAENERALELAKQRGYFGIGGSDAHYVSSLASCLTWFKNPVNNISQLVKELYKGEYRALRLEEAKSA